MLPLALLQLLQDPIYSSIPPYPLPAKILQSYWEGNAFGRQERYLPEEQERVARDCERLWQESAIATLSDEKIAYITAGAPGAGKTTLLHHYMQQEQRRFGYTDPDDRCLQGMQESWAHDVAAAVAIEQEDQERARDLRFSAYEKWRPASNAIAQLLLANFANEGKLFFYGSTSTSPQTHLLFSWLKEKGYQIRLIHLSAPDHIRYASIARRDRYFVQTTPEECQSKGELFPQRILDTYLAYADQIDFYWRDQIEQKAIHAASWYRAENKARLEVIHEVAYAAIIQQHNATCERIAKPELLWHHSVEASL